MNIKTHHIGNILIAEVISTKIVINNIEDGLELVGNIYFQGFDAVILNEINIVTNFFDLKTGIAGEILQKFSTYRIRLAIIGEFSKYQSKSLNDFIIESNKKRNIVFMNTTNEAIAELLKV